MIIKYEDIFLSIFFTLLYTASCTNKGSYNRILITRIKKARNYYIGWKKCSSNKKGCTKIGKFQFLSTTFFKTYYLRILRIPNKDPSHFSSLIND